MKPLTDEWISYAMGDYRTMRREHRVIEDPTYQSVCYHAQQCIEKLLKAFLHENGIPFPKTHDIASLIELALPIRPEWDSLIEVAGELTKYATGPRYPGDPVYPEDADEASQICEGMRKVLLDALNNLDQLRL